MYRLSILPFFIFSVIILNSCQTNEEIYPATDEEKAAVKEKATQQCLNDGSTKNKLNDMISYTSAGFDKINKGDEFDLEIKKTVNDGDEDLVVDIEYTVLKISSDTLYLHQYIKEHESSALQGKKYIIKFSKTDNELYVNAFSNLLCHSDVTFTHSAEDYTFTKTVKSNNDKDKKVTINKLSDDYPAVFELFRRYISEDISYDEDDDETETIKRTEKFSTAGDTDLSNADLESLYNDSFHCLINFPAQGATPSYEIGDSWLNCNASLFNINDIK